MTSPAADSRSWSEFPAIAFWVQKEHSRLREAVARPRAGDSAGGRRVSSTPHSPRAGTESGFKDTRSLPKQRQGRGTRGAPGGLEPPRGRGQARGATAEAEEWNMRSLEGEKYAVHIMALQCLMFRNMKPTEPVGFFNWQCRVLLFKRFYKGVLNRPWNCYSSFFSVGNYSAIWFLFLQKAQAF